MGGEEREKGEKEDEMAKRSHGAKSESRVVDASKCIHSQEPRHRLSLHDSFIPASTLIPPVDSLSLSSHLLPIASHVPHSRSGGHLLPNDRQMIDVMVVWL